MRSAWRVVSMIASAIVLLLGVLIPAAHADPDGNLYVWDLPGAGGASCTWAGDDSDYRFNADCGNFNDRVSSASNRGYPGAFEDVLFYEHIERRGQFLCLPNGAYWASMPPGWDNRVSSHTWGAFC